MTFSGEVVGINRRSKWSKVTSAPEVTYVLKSMLEFELDELTRVNIEIDGNFPLGTKFTMEIRPADKSGHPAIGIVSA